MTHGAGEGKDQAKITESDDRCAQGDLPSCHALGLALMSPQKDDSENNKRAAAAFEKGCQADYAPSCNGLGVMYAEGESVPRDPARVRKLYELGCKAGSQAACGQIVLLPSAP